MNLLINCSPPSPSSTNMHELDPTVKPRSSFPHPPNGQMKCLCRIPKNSVKLLKCANHILIKIRRNITPIIIFHCSHWSHHATKSAKLQGGSKMDLIRVTNPLRWPWHAKCTQEWFRRPDRTVSWFASRPSRMSALSNSRWMWPISSLTFGS